MSEIQKCPNLVRGGGGQHFSKMSEIQKCPNLVRRGGGQHFSKMSEIQKCPNLVRGRGRSTLLKNHNTVAIGEHPYWDIVPNFLDFLF